MSPQKCSPTPLEASARARANKLTAGDCQMRLPAQHTQTNKPGDINHDGIHTHTSTHQHEPVPVIDAQQQHGTRRPRHGNREHRRGFEIKARVPKPASESGFLQQSWLSKQDKFLFAPTHPEPRTCVSQSSIPVHTGNGDAEDCPSLTEQDRKKYVELMCRGPVAQPRPSFAPPKRQVSIKIQRCTTTRKNRNTQHHEYSWNLGRKPPQPTPQKPEKAIRQTPAMCIETEGHVRHRLSAGAGLGSHHTGPATVEVAACCRCRCRRCCGNVRIFRGIHRGVAERAEWRPAQPLVDAGLVELRGERQDKKHVNTASSNLFRKMAHRVKGPAREGIPYALTKS